MLKGLLFSIFILSILVLPLGCRRSTSVETPDGGEATMTHSGEAVDVTFTGPDGKKMKIKAGESGISLPDGFPKDVPIPPKAQPTANAKIGTMTSVTLESSQSVSEVVAFYKTALASSGWEVQATVNTPLGSLIGATKQKRTLNVMVGKSDRATIITLNLGSQ